MNITLSIQNDAELRAYCKDLIKGQVLAIVRGEVLELVKEEFSRKINSLSGSGSTEVIIRQTIEKVTRETLKSNNRIDQWSDGHLNTYVSQAVTRILDEKSFAKLVDVAATEKIKRLSQDI